MTLFSADHSVPPDAFRARLHDSPMGSPLPGQPLPGQPFGSPYVGPNTLSPLPSSSACSRPLSASLSGASVSMRGVLGAVTSSPSSATSNGLLGGSLPPHHHLHHLQQQQQQQSLGVGVGGGSSMFGSPLTRPSVGLLGSVMRSPMAPLAPSPGSADMMAMRQSNLGAFSLNSMARSLPSSGVPSSASSAGGSFSLSAGTRSAGTLFGAPVSSQLGMELVTPPPATLSLSDFPSLSARGSSLADISGAHSMTPLHQRHPGSLAPAGSILTNNNSGGGGGGGGAVSGGGGGNSSQRTPYVGMVKQQNSDTAEFTMSSEDFPALPGSSQSEQRPATGSSGGANTVDNSGATHGGVCDAPSGNSTSTSTSSMATTALLPGNIQQQQQQQQQVGGGGSSNSTSTRSPKHYSGGIQLQPGGRVSNIPCSMLADQFGIVGFLAFMHTAETDAAAAQLAQGYDLTTLGLNLKSTESQYLTYGGAWAETQCRAQDIDFYVPREYLTNIVTREKLAPILLSRYGEDLLFYLFYMNAGDVLQIMAARELYNREWRYHMEERVWITRALGVPLVEKTASYEQGTYYYFDPVSWRKSSRDFCLVYSKLDTRIEPPNYSTVLATRPAPPNPH